MKIRRASSPKPRFENNSKQVDQLGFGKFGGPSEYAQQAMRVQLHDGRAAYCHFHPIKSYPTGEPDHSHGTHNKKKKKNLFVWFLWSFANRVIRKFAC